MYKLKPPKWLPKPSTISKRYIYTLQIISLVDPKNDCLFLFKKKEDRDKAAELLSKAITNPEVIKDKVQKPRGDGYMDL